MIKNKEEILNDVKDIVVRLEGLKSILDKPDVLIARRKLQGIRDKSNALLKKISNQDNSMSLSSKIRESVIK